MWLDYFTYGDSTLFSTRPYHILQVADALATPFVGYESDRINGFCGYGKRKSWHLLGKLISYLVNTSIHGCYIEDDPRFWPVLAAAESNTSCALSIRHTRWKKYKIHQIQFGGLALNGVPHKLEINNFDF